MLLFICIFLDRVIINRKKYNFVIGVAGEVLLVGEIGVVGESGEVWVLERSSRKNGSFGWLGRLGRFGW